MKITSYITVYVALQNDQLNGSVKQLFLGGFLKETDKIKTAEVKRNQ